jgi:UDP-glucose 4-epimerase
MNILLTGCAGYIGSVTTEMLLNKGYSVIGIDNFSHGFIESVDKRALFYRMDVRDKVSLNYLFSKHNIDAVCHLAAESIITESMTDPRKFLDVNVLGGTTLLDVMLENKCNKFIMSSTASTYGEPAYVPMDEKHPQNPANFYGESKLIFERILNWYKDNKGLDFTAFRYFNVGGATENHGERRRNETRLVPVAIKSAYEQTILSVFGNNYKTKDGTPMRDYVHVSDVADAHILALQSKNLPHNYFNLGGDCAFTVLEIIEKVQEISSKQITYSIADRRPGDVEIFWADSSLAREELGWNPQKSTLHEIVQDSVYWFKQLYGYT